MSDDAPGKPTGWEESDRWFSSDDPPAQDEEAPEAGAEASAADAADTPEPEDAGPPRCTTCDSVLDEDQTYCLTCGEPTGSGPAPGRSLASPALIGGALAILGVGAAALALVLLSGDSDDTAAATVGSATTTAPTTTPTDPGTGPLPPDTTPLPPATDSTAPVPPETDFPTVTEEPDPIDPDPVDPDPIDPDPVDPGGEFDWPLGEVAWTAVLSSVRSEGDAIAARDRLQAQGEEAGVLFSSDHADLRPGYYVVFSGMFGGRSQAESRARALSSEFPGAYAREIS